LSLPAVEGFGLDEAACLACRHEKGPGLGVHGSAVVKGGSEGSATATHRP